MRCFVNSEKENDMKSLSQYSKKMIEYQNLPHNLSMLLIEMSADFGEALDGKMVMEVEKADFWIQNKKIQQEKPVSDKTLEMMFLAMGSGKKLNNRDLYIKGLSIMMSTIKAHLRTLDTEIKNQA